MSDWDCMFCGEDVPMHEQTRHPIFDSDGAPKFPHWYCALRAVLGGIGHFEDCKFWCQTMDDDDGGLTYRESSRRVAAWVHEHGIEAAAERSRREP
jgi:hypothetical protein